MICTGKWFGFDRTSSGSRPIAGYTIACDSKVLPPQSVVAIFGIPHWCEDTGSKIKGNRIDIYEGSDPLAHKRALRYGKRVEIVRVIHLTKSKVRPSLLEERKLDR
jgi:3D (Asp-Asp-Asp) domain-containing protein